MIISSKNESAAGMAYREEPLAGEEWLESYNRQENERLELKEKLERRLDDPCKYNVDFIKFLTFFMAFFHRCKCRNCGIQLLTNGNECYCCCELEGHKKAMGSEEVLEDLKADGVQDTKCVTQHPGFYIYLQKWSLKLAADKYKTINQKQI